MVASGQERSVRETASLQLDEPPAQDPGRSVRLGWRRHLGGGDQVGLEEPVERPR